MEGDATGIPEIEARDVAKYLQYMGQLHTTKNYLTYDVISGEVEKPSLRH